MTNTIQEALRLELLAGDGQAEAVDFGLVLASTSARLGYRGPIEVAGKVALPKPVVAAMRDKLINEERETPVDRYRITRADGVTIEGPFALETFSTKGPTFELVISCAGELEETGERDPAFEAKADEARLAALVEGARDGFAKVAETLVSTRPPEMGLDVAVSAVLTGGLDGLIRVMVAAAPDSTAAEVEETIVAGVRALVGRYV